MPSPYVPNATVVRRHDRGPHTFTLGVQGDAGALQFVPGQFVNLGLPDAEGNRVQRAYSVASAPGEGITEFALVLVDGGALTPGLGRIRVGDRLWMEQVPAGNFTLRDVPEGADLLVVATGTGMAPFMSMYRHGQWRGRNVTVVHGARTREGLVYDDVLGRTEGVTYLPVLSREPGWGGRTGRVQQVLETMSPDPAACHALLCGNPAMIKDVRALLESRGFKKHRKREPGNLHFEPYW